MLTQEFALYIVAGFVAQIIDGALGMAYGVTASSILIALGVPPAATSATVHAAECFTTGASALSPCFWKRGWLSFPQASDTGNSGSHSGGIYPIEFSRR